MNHTILPSVNGSGITQSKLTEKINARCKRLYDYAHTHPHAKLRYHASDTCLYISTDAAYVVGPKSRSRVSGYFYLSDHSSK